MAEKNIQFPSRGFDKSQDEDSYVGANVTQLA